MIKKIIIAVPVLSMLGMTLIVSADNTGSTVGSNTGTTTISDSGSTTGSNYNPGTIIPADTGSTVQTESNANSPVLTSEIQSTVTPDEMRRYAGLSDLYKTIDDRKLQSILSNHASLDNNDKIIKFGSIKGEVQALMTTVHNDPTYSAPTRFVLTSALTYLSDKIQNQIDMLNANTNAVNNGMTGNLP